MNGWTCIECAEDPWRLFPNGSCAKCLELNKSAPSEPVMIMGIKKGLDRRRRKHSDTTLEQRLQEAQDRIEKIIENHCRCIPADPHLCTACTILEELRLLGE